ncbi:hypothetical protein LY76DRAFT_610241 [Colletotrichum caudatum]|nr:hypothetical protein LY76DRAFT_610241 [Colletotrichum caudatum]
MITTHIDDDQSILSAIDRFVASLAEDKAAVAYCVDQYVHLETDASARFNIVTLRSRLPIEAVDIIIAHHNPSTWIPSKACQIPGPALVFYLHTVDAGRYFYAALHVLSIRCPRFSEARSLLQEQADIRRASDSRKQGVDKSAPGIILNDVNSAKPVDNDDDDLNHTTITLPLPVPQPEAVGAEDNHSLEDVQRQSPTEANPDPFDWDPSEVDLPPIPDCSSPHNLSSSSDDRSVHDTQDQTSSAVEDRFEYYESLDYNGLPAYSDDDDDPVQNSNSFGQDIVTTTSDDPRAVLAGSRGPDPLSQAPIQPQKLTMASSSNHSKPEQRAMPSAKRRRIILPNPHSSLLPGEEIQPHLVSGILQSLCDLIPHRAVCVASKGPATDAAAILSQTQSRLHGILHQNPAEAVIIMPLQSNHHWALAFVKVIAQKQVIIETYNAASDKELTKEAEGLICSLFDAAQDNGINTALPELCPRSSWNSISRQSVSQPDQQDSGVGVLIHSLYALAATSIPKEVDWLLWRRVLAAYKSARDAPLARKSGHTQPPPPPNGVLAQLRREHADSLGVGSGIRVPVPADSIIRRALAEDANWLSLSRGQARALDEALTEMRVRLSSASDQDKTKAHLARQTMYDINTLVTVLLRQTAEQPGPASNHLEDCEHDTDNLRSLIPLIRGGRMAKRQMQAALETAEEATRLAAARRAEEENNRQRSIQGLKAMQDEMVKIERELNSAGAEDSDEKDDDDMIDHDDNLHDSADDNSQDDDERSGQDDDQTDDEEE